jgi:hypothetical protein
VHHLNPKTDYPELVEGLLLLLAAKHEARRIGQCFDKLSMDGFGSEEEK